MNPEKSLNITHTKLKRGPLNPDFLREQIHLSKDQWNEEFRQIVDEKIQKYKQSLLEQDKEYEIETPEVSRENTFKRYTKGLDLDESKLKDKKILDLGCGEGEFVKYLIEKGITTEAYGIDNALDKSTIEDKLQSNFTQGNFEKDLPVKDADYIVSLGSVSNGVWGGEEVMNIGRIIEKSLSSLKENGEIRIYPLQEASKATPLPILDKSTKKWNEILQKISETQEMEFKIEPRDIEIMGKDMEIVLYSVLIIHKKDSVVK